MNTTTQTPAPSQLYILVNYYDAEMVVGQPSPDWPEYVVLKTYEGEDEPALEKLAQEYVKKRTQEYYNAYASSPSFAQEEHRQELSPETLARLQAELGF